ncbi:hypothetical protein PGTUg99_015290 [Puccinia graminis f. sp. tritici]|uniref:Uncharacterized protein n=1 Tax=Puccinia graminis f. sp. tritici TaxID=56615 RepID=A0A5B0PFW8_PUCGR|nr:hypothetical protein PGTUg99_015290 [Puccinia graminis f. sp. tritici]
MAKNVGMGDQGRSIHWGVGSSGYLVRVSLVTPSHHSLPSADPEETFDPTMADGVANDRAEKAARAKDRLKKFQAKKKAGEPSQPATTESNVTSEVASPSIEPVPNDQLHSTLPNGEQKIETIPPIPQP